MTWQVLILASVFLYSVSVLLQRLILKEDKSDPLTYSVFFQLVTGLLIGAFGFLMGNMSFPNIRPLIVNLILAILLYAFGNVFIFKALKQIEASKFTIVFSSRALFTVFASSLLIQEGLNLKQFLGTLLILSGIVIVNLKAMKLVFGKGELIGLLGAMCFGFANTNDRFLLKSFNVYPYLLIGFVAPALFLTAIYPSIVRRSKIFLEKEVLSKILLLCFIYAVSAITFFSALQIGENSSQVAVVNLTSVIITVLLSIIFLQEKEQMLAKLVGAVITFSGLVLLS